MADDPFALQYELTPDDARKVDQAATRALRRLVSTGQAYICEHCDSYVDARFAGTHNRSHGDGGG